jgi:hypothetical protein
MCLVYVLGISTFPLSTTFRLDCAAVPIVWYVLFFIFIVFDFSDAKFVDVIHSDGCKYRYIWLLSFNVQGTSLQQITVHRGHLYTTSHCL